jgi:hypothetical protein
MQDMVCEGIHAELLHSTPINRPGSSLDSTHHCTISACVSILQIQTLHVDQSRNFGTLDRSAVIISLPHRLSFPEDVSQIHSTRSDVSGLSAIHVSVG